MLPLPRWSARRARPPLQSRRGGCGAFRLQWLGRKQGLLNEVSGRWLKAALPEAKRRSGSLQRSKGCRGRLVGCGSGAGPSDAALKAEAIDITLPGTRRLTGPSIPSPRR